MRSEKITNTDGSIPQSSTILDYSHQCVTKQTMENLIKLAEAGGLSEKIQSMFQGKRINGTEGRAVLHPALRAPKYVQAHSNTYRFVHNENKPVQLRQN